jgi:hypothetical protein
MAQSPVLQGFAMFLYQCLRYSPQNRSSMTKLRQEFATLRPMLARRPWPLRLD